MLSDQKMRRSSTEFHRSGPMFQREQNSIAAMARLPYTPMSAAWPWFTVR